MHCDLWHDFGSVVTLDAVVAVSWGSGVVVVGSWVACRWCCEFGVVAWWRTTHFGPLWPMQRHAGPYSFGALQAYELLPLSGDRHEGVLTRWG